MQLMQEPMKASLRTTTGRQESKTRRDDPAGRTS
jgi:hypothetical protein